MYTNYIYAILANFFFFSSLPFPLFHTSLITMADFAPYKISAGNSSSADSVGKPLKVSKLQRPPEKGGWGVEEGRLQFGPARIFIV